MTAPAGHAARGLPRRPAFSPHHPGAGIPGVSHVTRILLRRERRQRWNAWTLGLGAIVLLGGGSWVIPGPRFAAELVAIAMIVAALASPRSRFPRLATEDRLAGGVILLLLAQMVPLPPALWTALPGRDTAAAIDLALWGSLPWRPFSLDPASTFRCLIALLPPLGAYIAMRTAPAERVAAMLAGLPLVLVCAAALTLGQMLLRDAPLLRPYPLADYPQPVGFFMNHNHQATLLVCLLPLLALWRMNAAPTVPATPQPDRKGDVILVGAAGVITLLTLATGSRSGAVLLPVSVILTSIAWLRRTQTGTSKLVIRITALVVVLAIMVLALLATGADLLEAPFLRGALGDDLRWRYWVDGGTAVSATWPWGSGLGTFVEVFASHEPLGSVSRHYLNHAHNDYLEIAIEAGVPGLLLAAAALWRSAEVALSLLRPVPAPAPAPSPVQRAQLGAALVVILLAALHSAVDYPLRTYAISTLVALCWALQANLSAAAPPPRRPSLHNEVLS